MVEKFIDTLERLIAEDDKYKVFSFDLEYTGGHVKHDQKVVVAQLCVRYHVLVYHYCLDTRPCKHFASLFNNPNYRFTMVDITNDRKVLKTSGLSCQKLVNILDSLSE
ncbi:hypothetical protein D1007_18771 [Hordeum vulgare]|nr:hypothetical protein D1007_18771 [Hordeum vulgare]